MNYFFMFYIYIFNVLIRINYMFFEFNNCSIVDLDIIILFYVKIVRFVYDFFYW